MHKKLDTSFKLIYADCNNILKKQGGKMKFNILSYIGLGRKNKEFQEGADRDFYINPSKKVSFDPSNHDYSVPTGKGSFNFITEDAFIRNSRYCHIKSLHSDECRLLKFECNYDNCPFVFWNHIARQS